MQLGGDDHRSDVTVANGHSSQTYWYAYLHAQWPESIPCSTFIYNIQNLNLLLS